MINLLNESNGFNGLSTLNPNPTIWQTCYMGWSIYYSNMFRLNRNSLTLHRFLFDWRVVSRITTCNLKVFFHETLIHHIFCFKILSWFIEEKNWGKIEKSIWIKLLLFLTLVSFRHVLLCLEMKQYGIN